MKTSFVPFALVLAAVLVLSPPGRAPSQGLSSWGRHDDPQPEADYPDVTVTAEWLALHGNDRRVILIDARPDSFFRSGHIPGALSIPAGTFPAIRTEEDLPGLMRLLGSVGLTGGEQLVCCGEASWSPDAAWLFWLLELAGARRVALLDGGVAGWLADGRPASTGHAGSRPAASWSASPHPERIASADYVNRSYGSELKEIIDARGRYDWAGHVERDDWEQPPRTGHIPHALPFDFTVFFVPDGDLREPPATRAEFAKLGPRPANPVDLASEFIVYGEGPVSSGALGYYLLRRAGIEHVRYYPGGWQDWFSSTGLPVVRVINAEELMSRLNKGRRLFASNDPAKGFAFFDVRHPADYARGHIKGSVSLRSDHFADSLDVRLDRYWPELDRTTAPIVTYCYGEYCIRSRGTSTDAARAGFLRVERFFGGLDEWQAAGGQLVTSVWRG